MTISYNADVVNASFWSFFKTMVRWRGSLWKMIYVELIIWIFSFTLISLIYRLALSVDQQILFEKICLLLNKYGDVLPVTFMLGFYVSLVITRWQNFLKNIGWVDNVALTVASYVVGYDERSLMIRRTIMRYLCCMQVLVFRSISKPIKKRFPTLESLVEAGYVTKDELPHFVDNKFWMPAKWSMSLVMVARKEGRVKSEQAVQLLFSYIVELRTNVAYLFWNDWVNVPILYTQVIFLIVRLYFLIMVFGRQFLNTERHSKTWPVDPYVPVLSIAQFTFLIGWSKVAEALLNPFGDDDDDYEMNFIIDRNLQLSMATVSNPKHLQPDLSKDKFFEDVEPVPFYSLETVDHPQNPNIGSAYSQAEKDKFQPTMMVRRGSELGRQRRSTQAALINAGVLIKTPGGIKVNENFSQDYTDGRRYSSPANMMTVPARLLSQSRSHKLSFSSNPDKRNLCPLNEDEEVVEEQQDDGGIENQKFRSIVSSFPTRKRGLFCVHGSETNYQQGASEAMASDDFESLYLDRPAEKCVRNSYATRDASTQTTFLSMEISDDETTKELPDSLTSKKKQKGTFACSNTGCQKRMSSTSTSSFTSEGTNVERRENKLHNLTKQMP